MHLSAIHLIFNLGWWWFLARQVERTFSSIQLVIVFLLTAVISNAAQAILVSSQFAGLSGVTFGLAGYVWLLATLNNKLKLTMPTGAFMFLIVWMVLGFAEWLPINMANWAHFAGLATGLITALIQSRFIHQNKSVSDTNI